MTGFYIRYASQDIFIGLKYVTIIIITQQKSIFCGSQGAKKGVKNKGVASFLYDYELLSNLTDNKLFYPSPL
jgi:hypothetical protein